MAFVFDATPLGATANSWATDVEADDYFAGRLNASAWTALANATAKQQALAAGTLDLERLVFDGYPPTTTQRLKVPRGGLVDVDGFWLTSIAVPRVFKEALFEHVLWLLNLATTDPTQPTGLEPFKSLDISGAVSIVMRDTPGQGQPTIAPAVYRLLGPYLDSVPGLTRLARA